MRANAVTMLRAQRSDTSSMLAAVHERADHVAHVVDLARRAGHDAAGSTAHRRRAGRSAARSPALLGQVGEQVADQPAPRRGRRPPRTGRRRCSRARAGRRAPAASTSSPITSRTTPGPVRNIADSSVMTTKSVSAGEYEPPPADTPRDHRDLRHASRTAARCGGRSARSRPSAATPSSMRAPPDAMKPITGAPARARPAPSRARSCRRAPRRASRPRSVWSCA